MKTAGIIFRVLTVILSALMVIWCAASMIVSIGSVVGAAVFGAVGLCAAFWGRVSALLHKLRERKAVRILINAAAVLLGVLTVYVVTILGFMAAYAAKQPAENATLIVLGCQVNGKNPSLMLSRRIDAAYNYLAAHPEAKCIVSGGKGKGEDISEAQCMYERLTARGISSERIYREDKSVNTEQNIAFSGEIIEREGLSRELAVVTDGFHEMRAAIIAGRKGYQCGAVPSDTPFYLAANFTIREVIAVSAQLLGLG